ncbi:MAG: hypothetical protein JOY70_04160, partial [Acidisphaera sp.]|nr:hypothetical protein [Acidisphaera sp.]
FVESADARGARVVVAARPEGDPVSLVADALGGGSAPTNIVLVVQESDGCDAPWLRGLDRLLAIEDARGKLVQILLVGSPVLPRVLAERAAAPLAYRRLHQIRLHDMRVGPAKKHHARKPLPTAAGFVAGWVPRRHQLGEARRRPIRRALAVGSGCCLAAAVLVLAYVSRAPQLPAWTIAATPRAELAVWTAPDLSPQVPTTLAAVAPIAPGAVPVEPPEAGSARPQDAHVPMPDTVAASGGADDRVAPAPPTELAAMPSASPEPQSLFGRRGAPGLALIAELGDTMPGLYRRVYRDVTPPPYEAVLAANPGAVHTGDLLIFPAPPGGWIAR